MSADDVTGQRAAGSAGRFRDAAHRRRRAARRGGVRPARRSLRRGRPRRHSRLRHDRRGDPLLGRGAAARAAAVRRGRGRAATTSLHTAGRRRPPTRWRSPPMRPRPARRRRGHRAAVLPTRRDGPAGALHGRRPRVRAPALLRLRVRAGKRIPGRPRRAAAPSERPPNLAGLKVSDTPWEAFEPYLSLGLDVFVGPEALIHRGIEGGAVGAVSALASPFPEPVAAVVREPTEAARRARRPAGSRRAVPAPGGHEADPRRGRACRCAPTCGRRCATSLRPRRASSPRGSPSGERLQPLSRASMRARRRRAASTRAHAGQPVEQRREVVELTAAMWAPISSSQARRGSRRPP